ncbi:MAG: ABC transporter permease subunit [Lachnospiraceae bacterium]|nr:ABC transporter permease subunit [Lachnospiraceae bacterium]QUO31855.1 ABC transporter permease subunit [Faecalicatena sp. Marseille-Q4148]RGS79694.1 ABC transporter permease subunit [Coprococcus sp. AF21-14LB]
MIFLNYYNLFISIHQGGEVLSENKQVDRMIHATKMKDRQNWRKMGGKNYNVGAIISLIIIAIVWYVAAHIVDSPFTFPYLETVLHDVVYSLSDLYVLKNLGITMRRVLTGSLYAFIIGFPLGMIMGYSPKILQAMSPFINSLRQVPIMAWVPLSIVWLGIGDGPTIFLIAFSGIFTIILNTVAGVQDISKDFYNAARSMGAGTLSIIKDIVIPGSLPGVLTGIRLAIGLGWMSVI